MDDSATASKGAPRKRNPYTVAACQECQRRKIKCSGERPCKACYLSRCDCLYEKTTRFRKTERQGGTLRPRRKATSARSDSPARDRLLPPGFRFDARSSEESVRDEDDGSSSSSSNGEGAAQTLRRVVRIRQSAGAGPGVILGVVPGRRWLVVIDGYEDEIGLLYPFMSFARLRALAQGQHRLEGAGQQDERVGEILCLLLATTAVLEEPDLAEVADGFVEETTAKARRRAQMDEVEEHDLTVLILMSIYHFMADREVLAWRTIGSVMRMLQELGYHRSASLHRRFPQPAAQHKARMLFWSVYMLDHRWSSGTGLPFAIHDADIDLDVNELNELNGLDHLDDHLSCAYIQAMVAFCRIGTEVQSVFLPLPPTAKTAAVDAMRDRLDFQVVTWRQNLPDHLKFAGLHVVSDTPPTRGRYRLRLVLYLRANQMRVMIHRKSALRSGPQRMLNTSTLPLLTEIARDTARLLTDLARGPSGIYQSQQRTFNHFLESAVSTLLLVNCRPGADVDRSSMKEVRLAMELIRTLIPHSPIMHRLRDRLEALAARNGYTAPAHPMAADLPDALPDAAPLDQGGFVPFLFPRELTAAHSTASELPIADDHAAPETTDIDAGFTPNLFPELAELLSDFDSTMLFSGPGILPLAYADP